MSVRAKLAKRQVRVVACHTSIHINTRANLAIGKLERVLTSREDEPQHPSTYNDKHGQKSNGKLSNFLGQLSKGKPTIIVYFMAVSVVQWLANWTGQPMVPGLNEL